MNMKIHVGSSGYSYKEWKGKFYPEKISAGEMLHYYAEHLSTVEINNTFYRMPTESLLFSWADQVPDGFIFAVKAPQVITHIKRLRDVGEETAYLFRTLSVLEGKLGPVLFQFPGSFRADRALLEDFLSLIPVGVLCAFEFRSKTWLTDEILGLLKKAGCCLCTADTDKSPTEEIVSTTSWGYLRLHRPDYKDDAISKWTKRVLSQKWKEAFIFFKHEEEAEGPRRAMRFLELAGSGMMKNRA